MKNKKTKTSFKNLVHTVFFCCHRFLITSFLPQTINTPSRLQTAAHRI